MNPIINPFKEEPPEDSIRRLKIIPFLLAVFALLAVIVIITLSCWKEAKAQEIQPAINMQAIAMIESSNNPMAYNAKNQATGLYQITPVCLADFRRTCSWEMPMINFTMENMFDGYHSWIVANWYLNTRIPEFLAHYKIPNTIDNRLWAYNSGIGNVVKGRMPKETRNYIIKYHKLTKGA